MANKNIGEIAKERWANMSEEERKAEIERRNYTKRKNNYEKRMLEKSLRTLLEGKWNFNDKDGKSVVGSGYDAMSTNMIRKAMSDGRDAVSAYIAIRDTVGEKPVDKVEQDNTVEVVMSDEMKKLAK